MAVQACRGNVRGEGRAAAELSTGAEPSTATELSTETVSRGRRRTAMDGRWWRRGEVVQQRRVATERRRWRRLYYFPTAMLSGSSLHSGRRWVGVGAWGDLRRRRGLVGQGAGLGLSGVGLGS
ncbi:unnamed protein product [Linum trigynum]|uniref:Uncharacterized protein n=1 Tax=Linum trigynum TaxID=586398 RepID=A0AAV2FKE2_9ROSI